MAVRIEDHLLYGEFIHTRRNLTMIHLVLKGQELPVRCELVGDPGEGLRHRHFRFAAQDVDISGDDPPEDAAPESSRNYSELRGTGWTMNFSTGEFCAKCEEEVWGRHWDNDAESDEPHPI